MDPNWLIASLPLIIISALLLWKAIVALISAVKASELAILPLTDNGEVLFKQAGDIVLAIRGKLGSRDFAHAEFSLLNEWGKTVPSKMLGMRTKTTNLSGETTLSICRYKLSAPGRYWLNVTGVEPAKISSDSSIVFLKPMGLRLVLHILLIVLSAIFLIGSCTLSAIIVTSLP